LLISEPAFSFDQGSYHVDESVETLEVKVWKTGTDLSRPSSVTVRSRQAKNNPADGMRFTLILMKMQKKLQSLHKIFKMLTCAAC